MASKRKSPKQPGNPDAPKRRSKTNTDNQFSIRLAPEVVKQLDQVLERTGGVGSRVDVLRRAVELGIPLLLERIGKA